MSQNLEVMFYVLGTIAVLFWVALPLVGPRLRACASGDALQAERIRALLLALKKLDETRDKVADTDYPNIERRLMLELAQLYAKQAVEPQIIENQGHHCTACNNAIKPHFAHCPACGTRLRESHVTSAA